MTVSTQWSNKLANFGKKMVVANRNGDDLPTIFDEDEYDSIEVNSLKRIIKYMTQYQTGDRKSIFEVADELKGTVIIDF